MPPESIGMTLTLSPRDPRGQSAAPSPSPLLPRPSGHCPLGHKGVDASFPGHPALRHERRCPTRWSDGPCRTRGRKNPFEVGYPSKGRADTTRRWSGNPLLGDHACLLQGEPHRYNASTKNCERIPIISSRGQRRVPHCSWPSTRAGRLSTVHSVKHWPLSPISGWRARGGRGAPRDQRRGGSLPRRRQRAQGSAWWTVSPGDVPKYDKLRFRGPECA